MANLLLAIAHSNFSILTNSQNWQKYYQIITGVSVRSCPVKRLEDLLLAFKTIPRFSETTPIPTALETLSKTSKTISWILSHCGLRHARPEFIRATGDLWIPGFHKTIHQFVLARPDPIRLEMFNAHHKFAKLKSTLLFHGTSMSALRSILVLDSHRLEIGGLDLVYSWQSGHRHPMTTLSTVPDMG